MAATTNRASRFAGATIRPLAVLVFGWLAAMAIVLALVVDGRRAAIERANRSSAGLALAVEEHTALLLQAIHITLRAIAEAHHLAPRPRSNDPEFQALMTSRVRDLSAVRAMFVIGRDGRLIHDTDYPNTPNLPLGDRGYFEAHAQDPKLESTVSLPVLSRSGTGWFVAVTERLGRGAFEGVVVAAVRAGYFEALYRRMNPGAGEGMAMFGRTGELVARYPEVAAKSGESFAHLALFTTHLPNAPSGTFVTRTDIFPGERIVSYRSVGGTPLVVVVSRGSGYLAEWRRTAIAAAVAMGALTLMLSWFVVHLAREHRRREQARQRRAQAEKMEALGQLTGGMAHDFANLLNIISLNLHLIEVQPLDEQRIKEAATLAQRAAARGSKLVSNLLTFAKRQPVRLKAIDLAAFVAQASDLFEQAAGPRVELVTELAANLPRVMADETQLEVAVLNLVVNARDAMSGAGRVTLQTYRAEDYVCLAVADNGPGMEARVLQRVLEPYFTTKGEAGTGLGLSQVFGFMQQIGGTLRIDSSPGAGTTVHLFFPKANAIENLKAVDR